MSKAKKNEYKKKAGRKAFKPSDEQAAEVKRLAGLGLSNKTIAVVMQVSESTLKKYYADELAQGHEGGKRQLAESALMMALEGKHPALMIFLLKTRLGWNEVQKVEHSGSVEHRESTPARKRLSPDEWIDQFGKVQ